MKHGITFFIIIVLLLNFGSGSLCIDAGKIITIGGEKNYPPYEYIDTDGEYRGFNVDLMKALALEMGIEIRLIPMDWVDAHISLQNGSLDAIQGMNYNEARLSMYDFSDEYLKNSLACFVRKDEKEILGIDSLKERRVAVQRSDSAAYALTDIGEVEIVFFSDLDTAFKNLIDGEVDAVVGNKHTGRYILQKNRKADLVKIVGNEINFTSYGMAFKKGNDKLLNDFNRGLEALRKKGTYYTIYEKWFGKEIKPAWQDLLNILYGLSIVVLVVVMTILFVLRINSVLKKEVEARTSDLVLLNNELKDKQQIIKESDRYKEQILNGIGNGLITFNKNGYITTLNRRCEEMLLIDSSIFVGKRYNETGLGKYINIDHLRECLEFERQFIFQENKCFINGREVILSYILKPLFDLNDCNIGAVITISDITEISLLRRRIAENEKMNSLGTLISRMSHEIRNPLTSIKAYVDLLPLKYDNEEFRRKITTQIPTEIERLNSLLTDLIDYSKPRKLKKEVFDIVQLINQTIDIISPEIENRRIRINYIHESSKMIYADMQQIKQIIINILRNSIDAIMSDGKIEIDISENDKEVILSVLDNGEGIDSDNLNGVLEPFYTTKSNGTGLGLALCYQYAKENNAILTIDSKSGEWTKVQLSFSGVNQKET